MRVFLFLKRILFLLIFTLLCPFLVIFSIFFYSILLSPFKFFDSRPMLFNIAVGGAVVITIAILVLLWLFFFKFAKKAIEKKNQTLPS